MTANGSHRDCRMTVSPWAIFAGPKQADLKRMVHIDWRRLPDIPKQGPAHSGFQVRHGRWRHSDAA